MKSGFKKEDDPIFNGFTVVCLFVYVVSTEGLHTYFWASMIGASVIPLAISGLIWLGNKKRSFAAILALTTFIVLTLGGLGQFL